MTNASIMICPLWQPSLAFCSISVFHGCYHALILVYNRHVSQYTLTATQTRHGLVWQRFSREMHA